MSAENEKGCEVCNLIARMEGAVRFSKEDLDFQAHQALELNLAKLMRIHKKDGTCTSFQGSKSS